MEIEESTYSKTQILENFNSGSKEYYEAFMNVAASTLSKFLLIDYLDIFVGENGLRCIEENLLGIYAPDEVLHKLRKTSKSIKHQTYFGTESTPLVNLTREPPWYSLLLEAIVLYGSEQGIFRKNSSPQRVGELKIKLDDDSQFIDFADEVRQGKCTVHDLVGVLKKLLYSISTFIPSTMRLYYIQTNYLVLDSDKISALQILNMFLPPINRIMLEKFLDCLHRVSKIDSNEMNASNLSLVITPAILCSPNDATNKAVLQLEQKVVQFCIENNREIFKTPPNLLKNVREYMQMDSAPNCKIAHFVNAEGKISQNCFDDDEYMKTASILKEKELCGLMEILKTRTSNKSPDVSFSSANPLDSSLPSSLCHTPVSDDLKYITPTNTPSAHKNPTTSVLKRIKGIFKSTPHLPHGRSSPALLGVTPLKQSSHSILPISNKKTKLSDSVESLADSHESPMQPQRDRREAPHDIFRHRSQTVGSPQGISTLRSPQNPEPAQSFTLELPRPPAVTVSNPKSWNESYIAAVHDRKPMNTTALHEARMKQFQSGNQLADQPARSSHPRSEGSDVLAHGSDSAPGSPFSTHQKMRRKRAMSQSTSAPIPGSGESDETSSLRRDVELKEPRNRASTMQHTSALSKSPKQSSRLRLTKENEPRVQPSPLRHRATTMDITTAPSATHKERQAALAPILEQSSPLGESMKDQFNEQELPSKKPSSNPLLSKGAMFFKSSRHRSHTLSNDLRGNSSLNGNKQHNSEELTTPAKMSKFSGSYVHGHSHVRSELQASKGLKHQSQFKKQTTV